MAQRGRAHVRSRHHYVPARYLRYWQDENDFIAYRDLRKGETRPARPDTVCSERDFHTVDNGTRESSEVEQWVTGLETAGLDVVDALRGGAWPPSPEAHKSLASYVALQRVRARRARATIVELADHLRELTANPGPDASRLVHDLAQGAPPEQLRQEHLELMKNVLPRLSESYEGADAVLQVSPSTRLITSDEPVVVELFNVAAGLEATYLPMGPRHALTLFRKEVGVARYTEIEDLSEEDAQQYNNRIYVHALDGLIGSRSQESILEQYPAKERDWSVVMNTGLPTTRGPRGAPPPIPRYRRQGPGA